MAQKNSLAAGSGSDESHPALTPHNKLNLPVALAPAPARIRQVRRRRPTAGAAAVAFQFLGRNYAVSTTALLSA